VGVVAASVSGTAEASPVGASVESHPASLLLDGVVVVVVVSPWPLVPSVSAAVRGASSAIVSGSEEVMLLLGCVPASGCSSTVSCYRYQLH